MMRRKDTRWWQEDNPKLKLNMVANTTLMQLTNRDFGFSPDHKKETNSLSISFKISPPKKDSMFPSSMTLTKLTVDYYYFSSIQFISFYLLIIYIINQFYY
jgi:hypothetical protein